jgi:hypothetical protein
MSFQVGGPFGPNQVLGAIVILLFESFAPHQLKDEFAIM